MSLRAESAPHATDAVDVDPHDELEPGEPHTPVWFSLLGGALLLVSILLFVGTRPAGKTIQELQAQIEAEAQAVAAEQAEAAALAQEAAPEASAPQPSGAPPPAQPGAHPPGSGG
jgi:hypothetical protein